jgi:methylmalonyl-CoA/ethylmalonyl-CoA epimerase
LQLNEGAPSLPPINHIGVVIRDVDKAEESLMRVFGCRFERVFDYAVTEDMVLQGEPFVLKIAVARLGFVAYEFLQPIEGKSIWSDFLKVSGEGLHHVAFTMKDWERQVAQMQRSGAKLLAGAKVGHMQDKRWAYFDTGVGQLIVELMEDYGL